MTARDAVLGRVREALGGGAPEPPAARDGQWTQLPRDYARASDLSREAVGQLLVERLRDYDAEVVRVTPDGIPGAVAAALAAHGLGTVLVPEGLPAAWLPPGIEVVEDGGLSARELDAFAAVLTGATLAIAETGTLVLQAVAGQGRRATTLVPDVHLCVVRDADVVQTVPEVFTRLASTATLPTTFVSGPSATADIEMTRIKGVHGPRFLHVLLLSP